MRFVNRCAWLAGALCTFFEMFCMEMQATAVAVGQSQRPPTASGLILVWESLVLNGVISVPSLGLMVPGAWGGSGL
jgi:hypothetical protein